MASFYVYSAADLGLPNTFANFFVSPSSTVDPAAVPDLLTLTDDDLILENGDLGSQILSADFSLDGAVIASIGDAVQSIGQSTIVNATTGEVGTLVVIQIDGVAVGYASTIMLNGGDAISMSAWIGSPTDIPYDDLEPSCFTRGTLIRTANGDTPIEQLAIGDMVFTVDHGFQPIRWIGSQTCTGQGRFAPICFQAGAIGNARELTVSPMHRMLVSGWRAQVLFGVNELLCHAQDMLNGDTIYRNPQPKIDYFHLMFDTHEIIISEGAKSESFHPFRADLNGFGAETRAELLAIFPELCSFESQNWEDARPTLNQAETALLQNNH